MSSTAQLTYFAGRGKAEIIRLMLNAVGIQYTDIYLNERDDLKKLIADGKLLFEQVPLLEIDGLQLCQSGSIVRYIAKKGGLCGQTDKDAVFIDTYYEGSRDFYMSFLPIGFREVDPILNGIKEKTLPRYLPVYEKILKDNNTGFLHGSNLSMADIGLLEPLLCVVEYFGVDTLKDYPHLQAFYQSMISMERLAAYLNGPKRCKGNDDAYVSKVKKILAMS